MQHHVHGYRWTGRGADLASDEGRRPEHPDFDPRHPGIAERKRPVLLFRQDDRPPLVVHHWLLKPIQPHATFEHPKQAVDWLADEWRTSGAEAADHVAAQDRREYAEGSLAQGNDVVWSVWMPGGNVVYRAAVPCPTRGIHGPVVSCPIGL
ncbi:hypothetical protein [Yinghuangia seranimata]|uniref:hypothetical protein n=1 Tax=Yinghuangia seranimata TaxID=408067 RepID=UPI00248BC320|nr:hypothetical protein [Yinghuangia seranimata]MDI2126987.1 hypothetical protein [Yinghuangia seranimata]